MLIKFMHGVRQFKKKPFKELQDSFEYLSKGQHPEILFITCSDSRIIPSLLMQSKPGDLFLIRNVGNIIPTYPTPCSEAAAIEYALQELNIKEIIICGHSHCGAMKGLLTANLEHIPSVSSWLTHAKPVLQKINEKYQNLPVDASLKLSSTIKLNIETQIENLKTYPLVMKKLERKEINIHAWFYELETGNVFIHEPLINRFVPLEEILTQAIETRMHNIVNEIAKIYLTQYALPQTAKNYYDLMQLFKELNETIEQRLWQELGYLYLSNSDPEFTSLVERSSHVKLKHMRDFQKEIQRSRGYQQYCSQLLHQSGFFITPKSVVPSGGHSGCSPPLRINPVNDGAVVRNGF